MIVFDADLEDIQAHWAIASISDEDRKRAFKLAEERLASRVVGHEIEFEFQGSEANDRKEEDDRLLERVALAYEVAATEGLDALSRSDSEDDSARKCSIVSSHKIFDLRRLAEIPKDADERIFHVLQISAFAYCGDRGSDLRRWFEENPSAVELPTVADAPWDRRLLYRLFDCWIRLLRKKGWDDLDRIREIIADLRKDQKLYEKEYLAGDSKSETRIEALRLISLYHWAKATEILAEYMLQGQPLTVFSEMNRHFESSIKAATATGDIQHEMILCWLHAVGRTMVTNSLWWATRTVNSKASEFVKALIKNEHRAMFELLPPQRAALLEQGLLDQAKTAIVIDMPTSSGKTLLAQFRILQALNQFQADGGWVAYVAPTKSLAAQITRRLRRDFEPVGLRVEQLSGAIEVDALEEDILKDDTEESFDVLVATPEKLSLVIRNKRIDRPLSLVVMDEAHNIENEERGLRIELLLATIKGDCPQANFLLLMPYVEKSETLARWLAQDIDAGKAISLNTAAWKPNERIIGLYRAVADNSERAGWRLEYETLTATGKAMDLQGIHQAGNCKPIDVPKSKVLTNKKQAGLGLQTAAMATAMSSRGTSIAVANTIGTVWNMARRAARSIDKSRDIPDDVRLVQGFLEAEFGPSFELIEMLDSGVGVHHAGLSDEVRALMEWLAESNHLRVLCATSTIAQGINFPVSSVFLSSRSVSQGKRSVDISPRDFLNLVGRAGRIGHDSVGVVGIAEGKDPSAKIEFVSRNTGGLASRLITLLNELEAQGKIGELETVLYRDQWEDFRCYIAHLLAQKKDLDAVLAESESVLRQTYGYMTLRNDPSQRDKADLLLEATKAYACKLDANRGVVALADSTGFSPEGVQKAMGEIRSLKRKLRPDDWAPENLFEKTGRMADLFGIMLKLPRIDQPLKDIAGTGDEHIRLSNITRDWVNGASLQAIAKAYFSKDTKRKETDSLTDACKAIYRTIVNNGTWGVSALSLLSGMDFDGMSETERRRINTLPAMIYHGVRTEEAVLMRMNSVPRSVAEALGSLYKERSDGDESRRSVGKVRRFLKGIPTTDWDAVKPANTALSGEGYRKVWEVLSGES